MTIEELTQEYMALRDSLHRIMASPKSYQSAGIVRHQEQMTARKDIVEQQLYDLAPYHAIFTSRLPSLSQFRPYEGRKKL